MTMEFKKIDPRVTIMTKFGEIKIRFYPEDAPRHIENFINLIKMQFYDGTTFHRIVPGFVIQGGDPLSKEPDRLRHGSGGPGYWLNPELSDRPHKRGAISMAKTPRESCLRHSSSVATAIPTSDPTATTGRITTVASRCSPGRRRIWRAAIWRADPTRWTRSPPARRRS